MLLDTDRFWQVTLASIGDAVIATDERGRVVFMNRVAESLCGWSLAEAEGRPVVDVFHIVNEKTRKKVDSPVDVVLRENRSVGLANHTVLIARDGRETAIDDSAAPIADEQGRLAGVVLVFRDISEKRQAALLKEHLAAIIESSDDIIISKNLDGVITSWNSGAQRVLGYTADEMIGKPVSMLMPPEHLEDTTKILDSVRQGQRIEHYRTKRRRKDGQIVDVSLTVSPIRDNDGTIVGASKVGRDVSLEQSAFDLQQRLASIIESSDDIIVSKSLDGVITSWNRGAERVLGYAPEEMIGQHISKIMPPEQREDMERILGHIRQGERVDHFESRRLTKDGRVIDVSLTVSPIRDSTGRVIGASKIGRDITAQKQIERERIEADRRKDEFLAMLAHELRNPLASISTATELLGHLEPGDDFDATKEVVLRQVHHLSRMLDDLLDVSRVSRGQITLRRETVDLAPIVQNAVETARQLMEQKGHQLTVSLAAGPMRINVDVVRMEQVLVNLLTNAAKYTAPGGRITIAAERENGEILIRVGDNGQGIDPELLPRMFEMFVQGRRSIARSEGGLGVGLALVRSLVRMHGGSVQAESEGQGKGSTLTVRLPEVVDELHTSAPSNGAASPSAERRRVLIVDDNADTAKTLRTLLSRIGHEAEIALDGPQALEAAQRFAPDVVLLDIGLPGLSGYEVARRLRQDGCCRGSLIIAVSGYGQDEDRRQSREAGFDHHLVKPVNHKSLVALLTESTRAT